MKASAPPQSDASTAASIPPSVAPGDGTADPALIVVYRETVRPLHQFVARRSGGSRELVEDVLQEVYLRAVEAWSAGQPPRDALPWLMTLARNLLIDYYRRHRPRLVDPALFDEVMVNEATSVTDAGMTPRAVALIHWALGRLPDRHARVLEAFHLDGRSVREVAVERGLSERAVEGRLARARKALKRQLEPLLDRDGDTP